MMYGVGWYKMHTVEHVEYEWRRWVMVAFQTFWSSLHSWFHSFDLGVSCLLSITLHPINKNQTADWEGCMSLLITIISQSQNIPNLIRLPSWELTYLLFKVNFESMIFPTSPRWDMLISWRVSLDIPLSNLPKAAWHRALCPEGHQLRGPVGVGWV